MTHGRMIDQTTKYQKPNLILPHDILSLVQNRLEIEESILLQLKLSH